MFPSVIPIRVSATASYGPIKPLGTVYEVEATTELDARARAAERFAKELTKHKLPLPAGQIHAQPVD